MWAFFLRAVPQAIKIYSMRGVPLTVASATVFLASFLVTEALRLTAGSAEEHGDLLPMPIVNITKRWIDKLVVFVASTGDMCQVLLWALVFGHMIRSRSLRSPNFAVDLILALVVGVLMTGILGSVLRLYFKKLFFGWRLTRHPMDVWAYQDNVGSDLSLAIIERGELSGSVIELTTLQATGHQVDSITGARTHRVVVALLTSIYRKRGHGPESG